MGSRAGQRSKRTCTPPAGPPAGRRCWFRRRRSPVPRVPSTSTTCGRAGPVTGVGVNQSRL